MALFGKKKQDEPEIEVGLKKDNGADDGEGAWESTFSDLGDFGDGDGEDSDLARALAEAEANGELDFDEDGGSQPDVDIVMLNDNDEEDDGKSIESESFSGSMPDPSEDGEAPKVELNAEDKFKQRCAQLSQAVRMMFPQQMANGFYYAELQEEGYIDDFCCYVKNGELLERDEIPSRCGMSDPEMISREEKLEQAFFLFRRAAIAYTGKPCNGVAVSLFENGQAKLDIVSNDLVEGEEDERYANFRKIVERGDPRYNPPRIDDATMAAIREKTDPIYRAMGQSFYNYIPGNEFRVAYFYAEFSERGVFYFLRMVANDGTVLDGDEPFNHFKISLDQTDERRNELVSLMAAFRNVFSEEGQNPCTAMTLTMSGDGRFSMALGYGMNDEEGEQERLNVWKNTHTGEGFPPVERQSREEIAQKLAEQVDPEVREQVNAIYMELGTEFFSYLPETEFNRTYFLAEFSDDGVFTYQRMILTNGETVEDTDMYEKFDMDAEEAENNRAKIIELMENIRELIINDGEKPFTSMTLAISDKGEFRTFMSFGPVDAATRDERLEAWRRQYNGGDIA